MPERPYNVLFLCTGNSARSIMAEAILNRLCAGKFCAYSAGSQPKGGVHPNTIQILQKLGYDTTQARSKSWNEFAKPDALQFDFIFTVCDDAAGEACPVWSGKPVTAHWGIRDPAAVAGSPLEVAAAFQEAYGLLVKRIELFAALPFRSLDELALSVRLRDIGRVEGATGKAKVHE
ncbi:MAG TPA: arsenate reductase ArsC [Xanthobacteraceae bacterium]|nr:arsenate reductase ArsC [Xanthobacteraceae bacterium]